MAIVPAFVQRTFRLALLLGAGGACNERVEVEETPPPDAGPLPDGNVFYFEPVPDLRGMTSEEALLTCGEVDGFQRCDTCEEECPWQTRWQTTCREELGVCVGYHSRYSPSGPQPRCNFGLEPGRFWEMDVYPYTGDPCAVQDSEDRSPEDLVQGPGMPPSYCVAAREETDLPPQKCVYPDGTEVITGPPDDPCPEHSGYMRVCGGTCGDASAQCPDIYYPCVGVSDSRAFGVCALFGHRCSEATVDSDIDQCERWPLLWYYQRPCACMVLQPQAPNPTGEPTGFLVPVEACTGYRSFFPDQVQCHGSDWEVL
jgi:hypothetical protein